MGNRTRNVYRLGRRIVARKPDGKIQTLSRKVTVSEPRMPGRESARLFIRQITRTREPLEWGKGLHFP